MTDILNARQLLDHLVSFPTVSCDTNLPLIHFVRDYFAQHDIDSVVIPNEDGTKAGLVAQVGPNGPVVWPCRDIRMWCRLKAKIGLLTLGTWLKKTTVCMVGAPVI